MRGVVIGLISIIFLCGVVLQSAKDLAPSNLSKQISASRPTMAMDLWKFGLLWRWPFLLLGCECVYRPGKNIRLSLCGPSVGNTGSAAGLNQWSECWLSLTNAVRPQALHSYR